MIKYEVKDHKPSYLPEGKEWRLTWADEFDGPELDRTKWDFRLDFWGAPFPAYTDQGIVFDGNSNMEIHRTERDGYYVSPQLQTGYNSFDTPKSYGQDGIWPLGDVKKPKFMQRYGYFECRCKFQKDPRTMWSAFWLQSPSIGTTYDATWSGVENDIMEYFKEGIISSGNYAGGYGRQLKSEGRVADYKLKETEDGFHTFGLYWSKDEYIFYCDGEVITRATEHVSQVPQFILLTTEVWGYRKWPEQPTPIRIGDERIGEGFVDDAFIVDHVRVFEEVE